ncbi:hypothetical protein B0H19DRAFT_13305 [Mycena capillaripes]|nr:hypothetical protein B0H19DRAFT_13305 [Mycena capillaripes]
MSHSFILQLPPEITATIFDHCLPSDLPCQPSSHEAPLLLAQICHQWREICLDTPDLWASVVFGDTKSIELLKMWLPRAGNHPLTLSLRSVDNVRADQLMQTIKPYCSQWKDVHFHLPALAHCQLNMTALPRLERLALVAPRTTTLGPGIIIQNAPLLRCAEIIHLPRFTAELPLEQLTFLTFRASVDTAQIIDVLRCCPNLLDLSCGTTWRERAHPPLQLSSLRSLNLIDDHMLHCLTVPRLEELQISHLPNDIDPAADALQSLVSRSSCHLQRLQVRLHRPTTVQSQRFFRAANSIQHLKLFLHYSPGPEQQIKALQGPDDVLPQLSHLEIHDALGDYYPQLLDLLRWRRTHGALESFELFLGTLGPLPGRIPPAAVMDDFRALAEAGLRLRVTIRERGETNVDVTLLDTHPGQRISLR